MSALRHQPCSLPLSPALVRPGGWRLRARHALSRLARCGTLDDVVAEFGSARELAEVVFGFPVSGGHATKPMVRAVGELLHHPLGAAPAAEAMAFAAEVQDLVGTHTLVAMLRQYVDVRHAAAVPDADELADLTIRLHTAPQQQRHRLALAATAPRRSWQVEVCDFMVNADYHSADFMWHGRPPDATAVPLFPVGPDGECELVDIDEAGAFVPHDVAGCAELSPGEAGLAARHLLYRGEVDDGRFALLTEHLGVTQWVQLFGELRTPADHRATLLRLVRGVGPVARLVALLVTLPTTDCTGARRYRWVSRDAVGRLTQHPDRRVRVAVVGHAVEGDLSGRAERRVLDAVERTSEEWLLRAAARTAVANVSAAAVDRLRDTGSEITDTVTGLSIPAIAGLLRSPLHLADPTMVAYLPNLAANQRSRPTWTATHESGSTVPYRHASALRKLDGRTLPGHEEWVLHLPRHDRELLRNADWMGNCTGDYVFVIPGGGLMIAMIDGPDGVTCNVEFQEVDGQWKVGDIRARFNAEAPRWMRPAIEFMLAGKRRRLGVVPRRMPIGR